ncbi:hypothetical protein CPIN17260_0369 [Campylobacter pinnipediorum subsp. pinnipediorum]|nr:hypothetical protein CPIN17260_0369 [Campylobacter pinnipediorum subsp. pinnipediorum]
MHKSLSDNEILYIHVDRLKLYQIFKTIKYKPLCLFGFFVNTAFIRSPIAMSYFLFY